MTTRTLEGARRIIVNRQEIVSWKSLWLLIKILFSMRVLLWSVGMPVSALAVALVILWAFYEFNHAFN